jgi:lipid-A-disaccharide synthase
MAGAVAYIIAGEASGDVLGARLMVALNHQKPGLQWHGVGGARMQEAGLESLFPMDEIAIMGFVEIVPALPRVMCRLRQTVEDIRRTKPDVLITIDAPGFCKRVAERVQDLRQQGMKIIHYVAPSVWAYRPERAKRMAELFDGLLTLLPFEPEYFLYEGLEARFVGHPVLEEPVTQGDGPAFRARHGIGANTPVLAVLPGSRRGELARHLPVFRQVVERLKHEIPDLLPVVLSAPGVKLDAHGWVVPPLIISDRSERAGFYAASEAALSKSGTITLELAQAGVPTIVAHKVHPWSARMLRKMIRIPYVSLVNILLNRPLVPEFLQEECQVERILPALRQLMNDQEARKTQQAGMAEALKKLQPASHLTPSEAAAEAVRQAVWP